MAKKQKWYKKWVFWVMLVILFAVIAVAAYFVCNNVTNNKNVSKDEATSSRDSTQKKEQKTKNEAKKEKTEDYDEPKVKQYEGEDPNLKDELSGVITYTGVNNDVLMIRVNIDQFVEGGMCNLTLVQNENAVFGASTAMIENASTATCDGFDVPIQGFESGKTIIVVDLEANGKSGQLVGEVEI